MKVENLKENDVSAQGVHSKNVDLNEALNVASQTVSTGRETNEAREKGSEGLWKEIEKTITDNKNNFEKAANKYGVSKYTIAAIIACEQRHMSPWENSLDEGAARAGRRTTSVGLGQVTVETAIKMEEEGRVEEITSKEKTGMVSEYQARINRLMTPSWNIMYVAAYLEKIQDARKTKFPEITKRPDILYTIYSKGFDNCPIHENPQPGPRGKEVNLLYRRCKTLLW